MGPPMPCRRNAALRLIIAVLFLSAASAAGAQQVPVFDPGPTLPGPVRASRPPSPLLGTPFEPILRLGQDLLDLGVLPRLRYVQSFAANPVGGLTQGTDTSGVVLFGADMDLNRVAHLPGAQLHVTFAQFYGHELATDHISARSKVQSFHLPEEAVRDGRADL
jgi:hypothetical protein